MSDQFDDWWNEEHGTQDEKPEISDDESSPDIDLQVTDVLT